MTLKLPKELKIGDEVMLTGSSSWHTVKHLVADSERFCVDTSSWTFRLSDITDHYRPDLTPIRVDAGPRTL